MRAAKPRAAYVFFNNDENMLANAREMLRILGGPKAGGSRKGAIPAGL